VGEGREYYLDRKIAAMWRIGPLAHGQGRRARRYYRTRSRGLLGKPKSWAFWFFRSPHPDRTKANGERNDDE